MLLFFGWVGVLGSFYLHTNFITPLYLLPASAVGFLATGVLNLNNLRDVETDRNAGKNTLVVRMGRPAAKVYQSVLVLGTLVMQGLFVWVAEIGAWGYLFVLTAPLIIMNLVKTYNAKQASDFDPLLKPLAISTLLFCLLAGIGAVV